MYITLSEVENEYRKKVKEALENKKMTAALLVELSSSLFQELKVRDLSDAEDGDMVLYQYGTYDWGNEFGKHFSFDITRQFISPEDDEPYQLHFVLIYDPEQFEGLRGYNCWNTDFADFESFIAHIKATDGFKLADKFEPKAYQIEFEQC